MKKYLMRGAIDVYEPHTKIEIAVRDYIGSNSGNMLYAYSVFRMLSSDNSKVEVDHYKVERRAYSAEDIDRINETYEAYILPLADAFRNDFINRLNNYSDFIEKLAIPCYVIGVGIRAPYEPDFSQKNLFDAAVVRFIKTVLAKSGMVGIRGAITGRYLDGLGFKEDRDYMVIGCPSIYTFGQELTQRKIDLSNPNMSLAVNFCRGYAKKEIAQYTYNLTQKYKNYQYIGQETSELRTLIVGNENMPDTHWYPGNMEHKFYKEDRVRFYINPVSWINEMKKVDFSIGGRLHGNIAAILGGAPAIFFLGDARTRELAEYLHLPSYSMHEFDWNTSLEELIERTDITSHLKVYGENFRRYIRFLDINSIKYEKFSSELDCIPDDGVKSYVMLDEEDREKRLLDYKHEENHWMELRKQS